jgi:ankyrin repeat protein
MRSLADLVLPLPAASGNLEILSLLVGAGADVTAANNKGLTAL